MKNKVFLSLIDIIANKLNKKSKQVIIGFIKEGSVIYNGSIEADSKEEVFTMGDTLRNAIIVNNTFLGSPIISSGIT